MVHCYVCGKRTRKDNLSRHCNDKHGFHMVMLRNDQKPLNPFCKNWEHYRDHPMPMQLRPRESRDSGSDDVEGSDDEEDDESSNIGDDSLVQHSPF